MLIKELIDKYFYKGFRHKEIMALFSLRTLHRFSRQEKFYRKGKQSPLLDIVTFIQHELDGSGTYIGYRPMHQRCIRTGLMLSRVTVAQIMKYLHPIGVNTKRRRTLRCRLYYSKGPNWI